MDAFVRRLIRTLLRPTPSLSRNRHFLTFETPEGRSALRMAKRLKSLHRDILASLKHGTKARYRSASASLLKDPSIEVRFERLRARRTTLLSQAEFELLRELPGIDQAIEQVE